MLHWYHHLRYPARFLRERSGYDGRKKIHEHEDFSYWTFDPPTSPPICWKISAMPWFTNVSTNDSYCVSFEEIRTILGPTTRNNNYLEGDDISENLYRASIGLPYRFGHSTVPYLEDKRSTDSAQRSCNSFAEKYGITCLSLPPNTNGDAQKTLQVYEKNNFFVQKGLGYCEYIPLDVQLLKPED